jgi:quinol-cytochrome oxidoreductase complex cytochrome b subunit
MFAAIVLLFFIPTYVDAHAASLKTVYAPFSTPHKVLFWLFVGIFLTLMFLGSRAAAAPYVGASKIFTILYFAYFLLVLPTLAWFGEALTRSK